MGMIVMPLGQAHRPSTPQMFDLQSALTWHFCPAAQNFEQLPPQSTSLSVPFTTPSSQDAGRQVSPVQTRLTQSDGMAHLRLSAQGVQVPPQSLSVSLPFWTLSTHVGALQRLFVHTRESQSAPIAQLWPVGHVAEHPLPHPGAPSGSGSDRQPASTGELVSLGASAAESVDELDASLASRGESALLLASLDSWASLLASRPLPGVSPAPSVLNDAESADESESVALSLPDVVAPSLPPPAPGVS
jgi:hypothetical protein